MSPSWKFWFMSSIPNYSTQLYHNRKSRDKGMNSERAKRVVCLLALLLLCLGFSSCCVAQVLTTEAGPYIRSRAAAAGDGIVGGHLRWLLD